MRCIACNNRLYDSEMFKESGMCNRCENIALDDSDMSPEKAFEEETPEISAEIKEAIVQIRGEHVAH